MRYFFLALAIALGGCGAELSDLNPAMNEANAVADKLDSAISFTQKAIDSTAPAVALVCYQVGPESTACMDLSKAHAKAQVALDVAKAGVQDYRAAREGFEQVAADLDSAENAARDLVDLAKRSAKSTL